MIPNNLLKHNYANDQNMFLTAYLTLSYSLQIHHTKCSIQDQQLGNLIYSLLMLSLTSSLMGQCGGEILKSKKLEANKIIVYQQKCRN